MLIAIVSDTHMPRGSRRLPADCLQRMAAADLILHVGDLTTASTLAELELLGPPLLAVLGNVDHADLRRELPVERVVAADGARIGMVHDAGPAKGRLARMRRRFPDADAVLFGHSHIPLHHQQDGFQIFNPGSPTERRQAPAHTMGEARVRHDRLTFELITVPALRRRKRILPGALPAQHDDTPAAHDASAHRGLPARPQHDPHPSRCAG